jgi:hypothetical protein
VLPSHGAAVDAPGRPANPQSDAPAIGDSVIRQQPITWAKGSPTMSMVARSPSSRSITLERFPVPPAWETP